jgi:hypothetical protein
MEAEPTGSASVFSKTVLPKLKRISLGGGNTMLRIILIIILVLALLGSLPAWPYSTGWGYYPSGGLGLLLLIILIFAFMGNRSAV